MLAGLAFERRSTGTACRPASDCVESGRLSPVRIGRCSEIAKNLDGWKELVPNVQRPKMLALPIPHVSHVECRIRFERGNLPHLSQRDPTRNLFPQEVLHNPPLRNRCLEAPSARARAPASPRWPTKGVVSTRCSERRLRFARHPFQRQEHGGPAETPRTFCGPMRPSHRRVGAVGLQLGRGQGWPRAQYLPAIFALRNLGRRQANEILEARKAA